MSGPSSDRDALTKCLKSTTDEDLPGLLAISAHDLAELLTAFRKADSQSASRRSSLPTP